MLTFAISVALMLGSVWAGVTWAKRKERRLAAEQGDGIEEVLGSARNHQ